MGAGVGEEQEASSKTKNVKRKKRAENFAVRMGLFYPYRRFVSVDNALRMGFVSIGAIFFSE
jgi:hypothetical protein